MRWKVNERNSGKDIWVMVALYEFQYLYERQLTHVMCWLHNSKLWESHSFDLLDSLYTCTANAWALGTGGISCAEEVHAGPGGFGDPTHSAHCQKQDLYAKNRSHCILKKANAYTKPIFIQKAPRQGKHKLRVRDQRDVSTLKGGIDAHHTRELRCLCRRRTRARISRGVVIDGSLFLKQHTLSVKVIKLMTLYVQDVKHDSRLLKVTQEQLGRSALKASVRGMEVHI